jgi:uncharacterized membrane protein YqiK
MMPLCDWLAIGGIAVSIIVALVLTFKLMTRKDSDWL